MAELHNTKKVQGYGKLLAQRCDELGRPLPPGDSPAKLVADLVRRMANQLGVTTRTVVDSYLDEDGVFRYAGAIVRQMSEMSAVMDETQPHPLDTDGGILVLTTLGMCSRLAVENHDRTNAMIVMRDAADSVVHIGSSLIEADDQPTQIGGMTVAVGRKVIVMTLDLLRSGQWRCTCQQPHRPDGGCELQDRMSLDLTLLGGWISGADDR